MSSASIGEFGGASEDILKNLSHSTKSRDPRGGDNGGRKQFFP